MPRPRSRPRRLASPRRASNPVQPASWSAWSGGVRADVGEGMDAQREDTAIRVKRELGGARHVAAVRRRQEFVHARSAPLDWTLELARTKRGDDVFGIEIRLHPETAADVT